MVIEVITQADRESAASTIEIPAENLSASHPNIVSTRQKVLSVRALILAGEADDHPRVQAAAFYRVHPVASVAPKSHGQSSKPQNDGDENDDQTLTE